jgi:hypothetical protein
VQGANLGGTDQLPYLSELMGTALTSSTCRGGRQAAFAARAPVFFDGRVAGGERNSWLARGCLRIEKCCSIARSEDTEAICLAQGSLIRGNERESGP